MAHYALELNGGQDWDGEASTLAAAIHLAETQTGKRVMRGRSLDRAGDPPYDPNGPGRYVVDAEVARAMRALQTRQEQHSAAAIKARETREREHA